MLDLNKLEKLLDETLNNETPESLLGWILSQRQAELVNYFGVDGVESLFTPIYTSFVYTESISSTAMCPGDNDINCELLNLAKAA